MNEPIFCLVNYFGSATDETELPRRYFSYWIVGGPGPTAEGGAASITTLAFHSPDDRCVDCQIFHMVTSGGPAAAVAKAVEYLDTVHSGTGLRKMQAPCQLPVGNFQEAESPATSAHTDANSTANCSC
jgi:hypothetical protein